MYFGDQHGVEFVYKEPKLTPLSDVSERLLSQYSEKFGRDNVHIIMDSSTVSTYTIGYTLKSTKTSQYLCFTKIICYLIMV